MTNFIQHESSENSTERTVEHSPGEFRPKSRRVGISQVRALWWSIYIKWMSYIERLLSKNPYNKNSWDKWPLPFGLLFLISKLRDLRSRSLADPYDYKTTDNRNCGAIPHVARIGNVADGTWASDDDSPQMGAAGTRISSNTEPQRVPPDLERLLMFARRVAKIRWRNLDRDGNEIMVPALILSDKAGGWIQFQFHGFGGNTKRDPITQNPHVASMNHDAEWGNAQMVVNRTSVDSTRTCPSDRPTPLNERPQAWIQAQIYGGNEHEQSMLRTGQGGRMIIENGRLPEDPSKPGIDLTGFNQNFNPQLSYLHWLFVMEHNSIAEHLAVFYPEWDDNELFHRAAKINQANMARIHTVEWTRDLLQHPTLQAGMYADWYGFFGKRLKNYCMRLFHRNPWLARLAKPITNNDIFWGMPGSRWEHFDAPFQVPKQFRMVYRLHELVRGVHKVLDPSTNRELAQHDLLSFVHENTRPIVDRYGYAVLSYSFSKASAGALTLHNFPRALTRFENQQNGELTDLAALDLFREMTDGTGSYNEFRMSVGMAPVESFMELTGGNVELARELEILYEYDINAVHPNIGILAEPKPAGFALSYSQFYQFVLNAPRRVKSNRQLTDGFNLKDYTPEGMSWVENSGSMLDVEARHLASLPGGPELIKAQEGVVRPFAPWPDADKFPRRMLRQIEADSDRVWGTNIIGFCLAVAASAAAYASSKLSLWHAFLIGLVLIAPAAALWIKRLLSQWFMLAVVERAATDRAPEMFHTLYRAEAWGERAARYGRLVSWVSMLLTLYLAWSFHTMAPIASLNALVLTSVCVTALLWSQTPLLKYGGGLLMPLGLYRYPEGFTSAFFCLAAIAEFWNSRATWLYQRDMQVLKVSLLSRLSRRRSCPVSNAQCDPNSSDLQRRYAFLCRSKPLVARCRDTYAAARQLGRSVFAAICYTVSLHLLVGKQTHRGTTRKTRHEAGVGLFGLNPLDIYLPSLTCAAFVANPRVYATSANHDAASGNVDPNAFDRMMRLFAPGRDYMTAYDFARMHEADFLRDQQDEVGNVWSRWIGRWYARQESALMIGNFADRVVADDYVLVPAISRDRLMQVYHGQAVLEVLKERGPIVIPPTFQYVAPVASGVLSSMSMIYLTTIGESTKIPFSPKLNVAFDYMLYLAPGIIFGALVLTKRWTLVRGVFAGMGLWAGTILIWMALTYGARVPWSISTLTVGVTSAMAAWALSKWIGGRPFQTERVWLPLLFIAIGSLFLGYDFTHSTGRFGHMAGLVGFVVWQMSVAILWYSQVGTK